MKPCLPNLICYRKNLILLTLAILTSFIVSAQPVISSFSPESGPVGTPVTITGSNFSPTPVNNIVFFGAVKATVNTATSTTLSVTVPTGATYEPISVTVNGLTGYSAKPFGVTFSGGVLTNSSFNYSGSTGYESDEETNDIATGDFDGDGKADIAIVERLNNYLAVYKNTSNASSISFSSKIVFTTGTQPVSLVAGDFDGDGKTDIAVTNKNDNTVSVFRNTGTPGTISFAAKTDFGTASTPLAIATGDFDGDGRTDIATANAALLPSFVSILQNTGSVGVISFAASNNIAVLLPGNSIAVADLNGDNKQDLVTTSDAANLMSVVINTSTAGVVSFATAVNYATGTMPGGLALGDLDGDNKTDITLANLFSNTISVFRNTSFGSAFSVSTRTDIALPGADHITITDADGDGKPDLAVETVSPNGFSILKNNGSASAISFLAPLNYASLCSNGIVAADWNGDGKTDLGIGCGVFRVGLFKNKTTEPQITSFTPTTAMPGQTVTISGVNLSGTTAVTFGSTPASSFTVVNATTITAVVGTGASGDITVSSPSGSGTGSGFTFTLPTPVITSFAPQSAATGVTVTINGTYFTGATAVTFGGVAATSFTVVNDATITAIVGAGTSGNVFVTTPYGTALLAGFTYLAPPTITSFSPTLGGTGNVISIFGTNFTGATAVSFGGTPASSFTVVSNTQINATVATGASGDISVTTANGTGARSGFTYMAAPVITSFSPASANMYTSVTINGANLYRVTTVSFGGTPASSFSIDSDNTIHAVAGNGSSGKISVTSPYGTTEMAGFTFLPPPVITTFSPQTGTVGTTVTITGANFTGATAVYIGNEFATSFTVVSPTTITAVAAAALTGPVRVFTPDGSMATTNDFTFTYAPPTITSFTPTSATTNGTVTITGTNFYRLSALTFGGVSAKFFVVNSPTSLTVTIGSGATGDVSISTPGGTATMPGFTYTIPPPYVSSASYQNATRGSTVSINGNNFATVTAVTFGGVPAASFNIISNTGITAIVGNGAPGFIKVISPTGSDSTGYFMYYDPVITSFSPASAATGTTVNITGTGFLNVTSVKFGDVPAASYTVNSLTSITAVVGAGNTGDVTVKNQVTARLAGFTFVSPTAAITAVVPGVATRGTAVKITGYKFTGATAVRFGNTPATSFVVNSDTEITAIVDAGASGDVSVTTPNGSPAWPGFIYTSAPVITSLSPNAAAVGASVTISGFNFNTSLTGNTVYFGAVKASVLSATATSMVVAVPAGATFQPVTVTSNGLTGFSPYPFAVTYSTAAALTASSFAPTIDSATIANVSHISISDLNLDGKSDVAVSAGNISGGQINLYKNGSTPGIIALPAKTIIDNHKLPQQAKFADLDGDGYLDLIAPNGVDGTGISVYRNKSVGGNFLFDAEYVLSESSLAHYEVGSGDLDGDGKVDLVVISPYSSKIYIYKNQSTPGVLSFVMTPITKTFTDFATDLVITDMDQDGKPDQVIVTANTLYILRNTSVSTAISFNTVTSYSTAGYAESLAAGDLDNDNRTDLVVTNSYFRTISLFHNAGTPGKMALENKVDLLSAANPYGICMANIDGDSKPDLIIANNDKNNISVYKNTSALNTISFDPPFQLTTGNGPYAVTVGDIDNDGRPDILTANNISNTYSIIRNQMDGYFVTAFTPASGKAQTVVTIKGTHFLTATGVQFGGKAAASFTIINDSTISAVIGDGNTGSVQVTWPATTAALPLFTYILPEPVIIAFTPTAGTSGTTVTITGTNFTGATAVSFGGTAAASFTVTSATSITAVVAGGASGSVSVTTPGGTASLAGFTYSAVTAVGNPVTANSKDLIIQPNPGRTIITVQHPASVKNAYLQFVDLQGRIVKQITPDFNTKQTIVHIADLKQGVYQLIWSDGSKTLVRSFIVLAN